MRKITIMIAGVLCMLALTSCGSTSLESAAVSAQSGDAEPASEEIAVNYETTDLYESVYLPLARQLTDYTYQDVRDFLNDLEIEYTCLDVHEIEIEDVNGYRILASCTASVFAEECDPVNNILHRVCYSNGTYEVSVHTPAPEKCCIYELTKVPCGRDVESIDELTEFLFGNSGVAPAGASAAAETVCRKQSDSPGNVEASSSAE